MRYSTEINKYKEKKNVGPAVHWGHDAVVSMPQGTNNLDWINECWDWLERFDSYFLMTDEDDPGEKAAIEIARRLPNCRRVRLGHKDANDALRAGMTSKEFLVRYSEAEYMDLHLLKAAETYEEGDHARTDGEPIDKKQDLDEPQRIARYVYRGHEREQHDDTSHDELFLAPADAIAEPTEERGADGVTDQHERRGQGS